MTAINWVTLIFGFILLLWCLAWLQGEVTARRKHKNQVELIKLGVRPKPVDRHKEP